MSLSLRRHENLLRCAEIRSSSSAVVTLCYKVSSTDLPAVFCYSCSGPGTKCINQLCYCKMFGPIVQAGVQLDTTWLTKARTELCPRSPSNLKVMNLLAFKKSISKKTVKITKIY